jgi:hypothetical protein
MGYLPVGNGHRSETPPTGYLPIEEHGIVGDLRTVAQRQIDAYGELMDSVYLYNREVPISYDLWVGLSERLDWLSRHWEEPDSAAVNLDRALDRR